jgi:hypothetical protein
MSAILLSVLNLILIVLVAVPSYLLVSNCFTEVEKYEEFSDADDFFLSAKSSPTLALYRACAHHPLLFVNAAFFLNVCVLFWLISRIQRSTWLIDPYWTIIPPMIACYYHYHPLSNGETSRKNMVLFLTIIWAVRYFITYPPFA